MASDNLFQAAVLLRTRVELDHAVAEFQRMLWANQLKLATHGPAEPMPYTDQALREATDAIAACAPDPHNFS